MTKLEKSDGLVSAGSSLRYFWISLVVYGLWLAFLMFVSFRVLTE